MALLTGAEITGLQAVQATITTEADKVRDRLNAKKTADPTNIQHPAYGALMQAHEEMKKSIARMEYAIVSNEDAYGK